MNKILIYLILSIAIVAFSVISLCSAPIINHNVPSYSQWAYDNCQYYADQEEKATDLNNQYSFHRKKTLCQRRKAMYGLEYASFIFDVICGFVCTLLSFLRYLNIGKGTEKNTGLVGLITGVVGFVLTFAYFVYSAYIFTNDIEGNIKKLFPNGATYKIVDESSTKKAITPYANDKNDDSPYIKYYELGQKLYNYDSDISRVYSSSYCPKSIAESSSGIPSSTTCKYLFGAPEKGIENKYLYDKWVNTLIFSFLISVSNIGLIIFGLLLFFGGGKEN
jgi:hypothetical protein